MMKPYSVCLFGAVLSLATGDVGRADWHIWTVTETRHVLRSEAPGDGLAVRVGAARNEWVSFQILLRSDEPVKGIRVEAGDLRGPGKAALPVSESRLYRQHQLHLEIGTQRNEAFKPDWYPDPLIPCGAGLASPERIGGASPTLRAMPFDLPPNETHGFWIDLYVPSGVPAGDHQGIYRVTAEGGKSFDIPVTLTVWDFTLPPTPTLVTAFGSPAQRMRDYYRQRAKEGKESEPVDWQAVETQCAQLLSEHCLDATPPGETLRPIAQADGSFRIPSEQVQALREFVDRYHVNALQTPHPSSVIKDPEAERDKLRAWLAAFDQAAKELNRPHIVFFIYLRDEPNTEEDYRYVQKWGRAIREAKSVVQVMVVEQTWTEPRQGGADSTWGDLYGAVDIWCPLFSLHRQDSAAKRQALGETIWTYTALCQGTPTPWWHIDYPLLNYRVPTWMAWRDRMKGLLYWGGMSYWRQTDDPWLHAPIYTGSGRPQQGDKGIVFNGEGSLVYPARAVGYDGIVPTIRLKALRDAIEDYEYLAILDRLGRSKEADQIVRRLTESWFQWDKDPAAYEKARAELAEMIVGRPTGTNSVLRTALPAVMFSAVGPGGASGEPWHAVEQPELKEALERAPTLQTESLGEPARGVNVWERWLVPNPDGKTWDVLQVYFKEYYGPTWLYAIDLGTSQVKKQRLADGHQFYLSGRALGFDGKYYIATPSRKTWSMDLFVYDPATNTLEERGEIVHGLGGEVRPLVVGPDGRIYGTGTRGNQVGLYIYDPKLGKVVKDFGPVGPSHPNGAWSRYVMGVDDTHAYIASGMIPAWYLVTVNLETGEQKVLLESPTERVMDIIERFPGAYARIPQDGGAPNKEYWLYHGQATPRTNDAPPWPKQASPWDKAVAKPEVYFDQIDPDADGNATLWYRSRESVGKARSEDIPPLSASVKGKEQGQDALATAGWQSIRLEGVESYPHRTNPMSILPDGRLYGTGDDYAGVFVFDPRTDQTTIVGPRPGLAPYTQIVCGGKLYSSGYSGGHLFVYDPARPWTLSIGGPPGHPAPNQADARCNPRYLGDFDKTTRVGLMHSSALGADGKVYFGGFGLRHYTGGGFGWYDPKTQEMDGFWKPLSGYAVQWIAPALDGRLIGISTIRAADELNDNRAPEEAKLFVYDVREQRIVREIVPMAKGRTTGLITEVAPGRLLGLTSHPEHRDRSVLYGVDVVTGAILFTKDLPSPVSVDDHWPHWVDPSYEYNAFVRGPDGFVWTYLKNVLVRIDPKGASVHVVGKIDPVGWPTFVGNDVYFSGPEQLRRIRHIVPTLPRNQKTISSKSDKSNPHFAELW